MFLPIQDQLFQFEELLQSEFNKGQLQPITTGMMCVAFYKGQFNRAHVGSIEGEKVCVLLLSCQNVLQF